MTGRELLQEGKLSEAVSWVTKEVKLHPSDVKLRIFLFELLCFSGDYDRASRQLDVVGHQDESAEVGVDVYRNLLRAEGARRRLFADGLRPIFLYEPPGYIHLHLDALACVREHRYKDAIDVLTRSSQLRPQVSGQIDGRAFASLSDTDDVFAPILEVLSKGDYYWVPFEQVRKISISKPKFLRDLLWIPATVETTLGSTGEVFLPVLYPGSDQETDDQVRLGRMTDWKTHADGPTRGVGQRTFMIDNEERAILEVRDLELSC